MDDFKLDGIANGIPYRTLQDWELGNTQAPEYVLRLVAYKVQMEKERGNL